MGVMMAAKDGSCVAAAGVRIAANGLWGTPLLQVPVELDVKSHGAIAPGVATSQCPVPCRRILILLKLCHWP